MNIDYLWNKIKSNEGETFYTVRDLPFTYKIIGGSIRPSRAKQNISKSCFEKALSLMPLKGPGDISNAVRGSAYVYAILTDKRIRE